MNNKNPVRVKKGGGIGYTGPKPLWKQFDELDNLVKALLFVFLFMVAAMILTTTNMYLDQAHFNSTQYDAHKAEQSTFQSQLINSQNQIKSMQSLINSQQMQIDALKAKVGN